MEFGLTLIETLEKHHVIAKEEGLHYAYIVNTPGHPSEHTYCPECKDIAVRRYGCSIKSWNLDANNCCKNCGYPIGKPIKPVEKNRFQLIRQV